MKLALLLLLTLAGSSPAFAMRSTGFMVPVPMGLPNASDTRFYFANVSGTSQQVTLRLRPTNSSFAMSTGSAVPWNTSALTPVTCPSGVFGSCPVTCFQPPAATSELTYTVTLQPLETKFITVYLYPSGTVQPILARIEVAQDIGAVQAYATQSTDACVVGFQVPFIPVNGGRPF